MKWGRGVEIQSGKRKFTTFPKMPNLEQKEIEKGVKFVVSAPLWTGSAVRYKYF